MVRTKNKKTGGRERERGREGGEERWSRLANGAGGVQRSQFPKWSNFTLLSCVLCWAILAELLLQRITEYLNSIY
jgi:hypothetical protein